jgi:hypothetical protein
VVRASYSNHYRRILPLILNALDLRSNNARHKPVMEAIELIRRNRDARHLYYRLDEAPIDGVIKNNMRSIIVETDSRGSQRDSRRFDNANSRAAHIENMDATGAIAVQVAGAVDFHAVCDAGRIADCFRPDVAVGDAAAI